MTLDKLNNKLTVDHLENVQALLPSPSEIKILPNAKKSQHPAEMFLCLTLDYLDLPRRLNIFIICENFGANCNASIEKAKAIITACNEV